MYMYILHAKHTNMYSVYGQRQNILNHVCTKLMNATRCSTKTKTTLTLMMMIICDDRCDDMCNVNYAHWPSHRNEYEPYYVYMIQIELMVEATFGNWLENRTLISHYKFLSVCKSESISSRNYSAIILGPPWTFINIVYSTDERNKDKFFGFPKEKWQLLQITRYKLWWGQNNERILCRPFYFKKPPQLSMFFESVRFRIRLIDSSAVHKFKINAFLYMSDTCAVCATVMSVNHQLRPILSQQQQKHPILLTTHRSRRL